VSAMILCQNVLYGTCSWFVTVLHGLNSWTPPWPRRLLDPGK
jgi:hypothetical protein